MQITRQDPKRSLASRCRHYVSIQNEVKTSDNEGGFVNSWVDIATTVPAEILPITATRKAEFRSFNVNATHYIRVRHFVPTAEIGRIVFGARYFYVHTLENIQEKSIEQFMICEERRP